MSDLTGALAYKLVRDSEIFPLMSVWGQKPTSAFICAKSAHRPTADNRNWHGWLCSQRPAPARRADHRDGMWVSAGKCSYWIGAEKDKR
jgi:hypothetical protein